MWQIVAFLGLTLGGWALAPVAVAVEDVTWAAVTLPAARQTDVQARESGHPYRLFVSVPEAPPPPGGYPVFFVLDGNAMFPVASFLARAFASRRQITGLPLALVVGIGYPGDQDFDVPARRRDYTISPIPVDAKAKAGGADRFLDFIEQDVKPLVAANYLVNAGQQALFGHSYGGLLVLHALMTRPTAYSTFVAASPAIWWQDRLLLSELPGLKQAKPLPIPHVQISVGALEDQRPKGNYPSDMLALKAQRPMVSEARQLAVTLKHLPGWKDNVVYYELAGEDHGPAWLPAMTRGIQFFLEQHTKEGAAQ